MNTKNQGSRPVHSGFREALAATSPHLTYHPAPLNTSRPIIGVTGGYSFAALPENTVVADDYLKIKGRQVGDPVEYHTSDGVKVLGVVVDVMSLSLLVAFTGF